MTCSKYQNFRWFKIRPKFSEDRVTWYQGLEKFGTRNREVRFCENFDRKFLFKQIIIELYDINEKSAYWKKRFVHPSLFPSSFTNHEMAHSSSDDDFIYHYDNNNKPDSSIDRHATVPSKVRLTFCKSKMGKIKVIYWPFFDILIS